MGRADDLDFLNITPSKRSSREWQRLARRENYGLSRINSGSPSSDGPGRPKGGQKRTPERMLGICRAVAVIPVVKDACARNGVTTHALKQWLVKSRLGQPGDGFDIVVNPEDDPSEQITQRFHEVYETSLDEGSQELFRATWQRAIGYREPLTFQGRVMYKFDPVKLKKGAEGMDAYLLDENGRPVPESIEKQDPDLMQFLLKGLMPDKFGNKTKIEMEGRISGVLVVAQKAISDEALMDEAKLARTETLQVEFDDGEPGDF